MKVIIAVDVSDCGGRKANGKSRCWLEAPSWKCNVLNKEEGYKIKEKRIGREWSH